jgi:2-polyprenyl-6-methoxyphenol hydroxylase-like FAD-dependent oxidoreductase
MAMMDSPANDARSRQTQCCIAGGGPAGMMLGFLLARAGVPTVVLEKHRDFLRDFRGDTIHPSTLAIMDELGLLDRFLKLPHQKLDHIEGWFGAYRIKVADFHRLRTRCPYIVLMPQWDFLNFLAVEGRGLPDLTVMMCAEVTDVLRTNGRVTGVRANTLHGPAEIRATLTIGADGRHSTVRQQAGLELEDIGAPIDVLWFRVRREAAALDRAFTHITPGKVLITLDRGDYWQCAYVIRKGAAESVKARGLSAFLDDVGRTAPSLKPHLSDVKSWDDVKLLTVAINRLKRWSAPGLLCIGDAAHAMSPVGGVGINLAIQDAIATSNLLGEKLRSRRLADADLPAVQRRRAWPAKMTQAFQVKAQDSILTPVLTGNHEVMRPPLALRLMTHSAWLRSLAARVVGLGFRLEHVQPVRPAA